MTDEVNPKWSDLPERTLFKGGWDPEPGRFSSESTDRCEEFYFKSCTFCGAMIDEDSKAMELHTKYHKAQGH